MLAVRNLTEGCEANQDWIRAMKPQKAVPSEELEQQGVSLVFDEVRAAGPGGVQVVVVVRVATMTLLAVP